MMPFTAAAFRYELFAREGAEALLLGVGQFDLAGALVALAAAAGGLDVGAVEDVLGGVRDERDSLPALVVVDRADVLLVIVSEGVGRLHGTELYSLTQG